MIPWKPFIVSGLGLKQKVKLQSRAPSGVSKRITSPPAQSDTLICFEGG
jgi:hypothetical protein